MRIAIIDQGKGIPEECLDRIFDPYFSSNQNQGGLALASALARSGVGPDSEVLVPAYHCQSIVEPIEALGARPVFYRVQTDLSVDFSDIERKLTRDVKSIVAVHFFGISADMSRLRELCNEVGATLI